MKTYKIIDESSGSAAIAILCFFEKSRTFAIEISPEIPPSELPIFFAGFAEKGILSPDMEWSERWVRERIVPEDRQNLGSILRDNNLGEYDIMKLLIKSDGRSAQDDCAIIGVNQADLPLWFAERQSKKIRMVAPFSDFRILLSFYDGRAAIVDLSERVHEDRKFMILEHDGQLFDAVEVQPGGNGICWNDWLHMSAAELYDEGSTLAITADEIDNMIERELMDTQAVCEELNCSRQYIDKLVREGTLPTVRATGKSRLYHRSDVKRLKW